MSSDRHNVNSPRAKRYRLMMEAGRDNDYIAQRMGVSKHTVERWRWLLSLPSDKTEREWLNSPLDYEQRRKKYKALFDKGLSNAEVAKIMRVKPHSVARQRKKICGPALSHQERHGYDLEHIAAQYNLNGLVKPLAREYGVSEDVIQTALKHAREQGLVTREARTVEPYTEEELERARVMLEEEGMSYAMTLKELGRSSADALARHLPGMGWTPQQRMEYRWMKAKLDSL